jgi:shikimate dehydrogenase
MNASLDRRRASWVRGSTTVAGVIGDPIRHSRSPAIHNAAFAAVGLDWVFCAFQVPPGGAGRALGAMRALHLGGLSVTMPHKQDAAEACDDLTPEARSLASINTVIPLTDGRLLGASTDGAGLLGLLRDHDQDPVGASALVLGAGGAARAIALALAESGATVTVAARRREPAESAAVLHAAIDRKSVV